MVAVLEQVLGEVDRQAILKELKGAPMLDGRSSAGQLGQGLKATYQVDTQSQAYESMLPRIMRSLDQHSEFKKQALAGRILPPLVSRYSEGCFYKRHVDNALMGPFPALRTDLSFTIALNDPGEYEGGTLCLETEFGVQEYRLAAGDAILYPTHYPHWVTEITRGERLAVISWVESLVRDPMQRDVLVKLTDLMEWGVEAGIDTEALVKIEHTRLNLLKMWVTT